MPAVAPDTIYNRKHSLADLESFVDSAFNDFRASVEDQIVTCRAIREKAKPRILPVSRFLPDEASLTRLEEALDIRCKEQADQWTRRVSRQLDRQDTEEQQVQCVSTETFKAFDFSWDLSIVDRPTAIGVGIIYHQQYSVLTQAGYFDVPWRAGYQGIYDQAGPQ
jgi:hypothetical protein